MDVTEQLLVAGDALARSIGHHPNCLVMSPMLPPCTCHASKEQAVALDNWLRLSKELKKGETNVESIPR